MAHADAFAVLWYLSGLIAALLLAAVLWTFALRALRRSQRARDNCQQQLQLLIDGTVDYALFMLDASGSISEWNAGAERLHGYVADEMLGQHYACLFSLEDRAAKLPQHILEVSAREGRHALGGWRLRKGGARFFAETLIQARRERSGRLIGFRSIERDVTERLQQQAALQRARNLLAQAQKLVAVGHLSDGIAHEFNNVVHVIRTCVEVLQRDAAARPQDAESLQMIKRNAERAATLSQHLLGLARRQRQHPTLTDINEVVTDVVTLLRQTLNEDISVDLRVDEGLSWALVDRSELAAALVNLAANARDVMAAGGLLSIATTDALWPEADADNAEHVRSRHYVVISISRTHGSAGRVRGEGLDEPRTRVDAGLGPEMEPEELGLEMVRSFVEQYAGRLVREDQPSGTTVRLYLPPAPAGAAGLSAPVLAPSPLGRP